MSKQRASRGTSAWLVTWARSGPHVPLEKTVAAVLSSRWSSKRVLEMVELLFAQECFSPSERVEWARGKFRPYPAEYVSTGGVPFQGQIVCGADKSLYARMVKNLRAEEGDDGDEQLLWDEIPLPPRIPQDRAEIASQGSG